MFDHDFVSNRNFARCEHAHKDALVRHDALAYFFVDFAMLVAFFANLRDFHAASTKAEYRADGKRIELYTLRGNILRKLAGR